MESLIWMLGTVFVIVSGASVGFIGRKNLMSHINGYYESYTSTDKKDEVIVDSVIV